MRLQKTYQKHSLTKIFFAMAFLIALSFSSGYIVNTSSPYQEVTKTELVLSCKVKRTNWTDSFSKTFNLNKTAKPAASKNYEAGFLLAYNKLTEVKFDNLSLQSPLITSPSCFNPVKTIPKSSKENDFISFAG
jgi:hypothetical protein